jgi:hypothetical protein
MAMAARDGIGRSADAVLADRFQLKFAYFRRLLSVISATLSVIVG